MVCSIFIQRAIQQMLILYKALHENSLNRQNHPLCIKSLPHLSSHLDPFSVASTFLFILFLFQIITSLKGFGNLIILRRIAILARKRKEIKANELRANMTFYKPHV